MLATLITEISNDQNGVKPRDFMANNPLQIRLQQEFRQNYAGQYFFEIKRGEPTGAGIFISNEEAGLLLMAFDRGKPWATHRKYQVFEDKYNKLFARKEVTADRVVLCRILADAVDDALPRLTNGLVAKYVLTRYMLLYFVRNILKKDELWGEINTNPQRFVRSGSSRQLFRKCIDSIVSDLITDVNAEIEGVGDDFDYWGKLRDSTWVETLHFSGTVKNISRTKRKLTRAHCDRRASAATVYRPSPAWAVTCMGRHRVSVDTCIDRHPHRPPRYISRRGASGNADLQRSDSQRSDGRQQLRPPHPAA